MQRGYYKSNGIIQAWKIPPPPSEVPRYHIGQNPKLQKAHTQHKDEGGHPIQPPEEVIKLQMGLQRNHYLNNNICVVLHHG